MVPPWSYGLSAASAGGRSHLTTTQPSRRYAGCRPVPPKISLLPALRHLLPRERDLVAELLEPLDVMALYPLGAEPVEVARPEVAVGPAGLEQVVGDHQHAVGHRHRRLVLAPAPGEPVVLRGEVAAPRAGEAPGH